MRNTFYIVIRNKTGNFGEITIYQLPAQNA